MADLVHREARARPQGLAINPVIYAELAAGFLNENELEAALDFPDPLRNRRLTAKYAVGGKSATRIGASRITCLWLQASTGSDLTSSSRASGPGALTFTFEVPLLDPAGKAAWQHTWATFHFDADGKLIRRIKRFISNETTNTIRVVWKEWEIESGVSSDALLESAKDE